MLSLDEFVMLAECDDDRHLDGAKILFGIVRLGSHHQPHRANELVEVGWRGGEHGVVFPVATEAAIEKRTRFDLLCAARIHVAGKKEHACHAGWRLGGKDQSDTGAVTPADEGSLADGKMVHHSYDVGSHEFIGIWPVIAG